MQPSASSSATVVRVAVVGGGDLEAVEQIVRALPPGCGLAIVVACTADRDVAGALRHSCALPVEELHGEISLRRGRVYVLPRNAGVIVGSEPLALREVPGAPRSLDETIRSLAERIGHDVAAVVLAGPGLDGTAGLDWIREAGGLTIATDAPATAGGPGLVDLVLTAQAAAARLVALGRQPAGPAPHPGEERSGNDDALRGILEMLRARWDHDFRSYKRAALLRRIRRRMQICETSDLGEYMRYLRTHPHELAELRHDLLIKVTSFFRDPETFDALARRTIPALFASRTPDDPIRVWVPGCSTGEEAYSLAILLAEHARELNERPRCRLFATDIDEEALARARAGIYPDSIRCDLTPERLERNFVRAGPHYRVCGELREMVAFSQHDVLRDPQLPSLDLISCRNLLIYLEREARERVLASFHLVLRPRGFLFLGSTETAEGPATRFGVVDAKHRIYVRRPASIDARPRGDERVQSIVRGLHQMRERLLSTIELCESLKASSEELGASDALRSAAEERMCLAVRAARMAVIGFDAELRVAWGCAPGAEPPAEPARLLDVLVPGQAKRLMRLLRAASCGRSQHAELELLLEGQSRVYDFRFEPAGAGVVAVGFDITPAKLAQTALLEADRRKDEFLATLSHELRNPLAPLRVAIDVAKLADEDPEQRARSLAIMERQVAQLTRLIEDLFDLSQIAHGKLELKRAELDPVEIVNAALETASPLLAEHSHRVQVQLPETSVRVMGDFHRLVQVVTNLLSNAAKYTPDGGRIEVELRTDPRRRVVAFRVRDTGIGIDKEMLSSIFDIFVQSRGMRGRTRRGLGVGLNVVRGIVELHGGTVAAASAGPDRGSEFVVELPIAEGSRGTKS